MRRAAAAAAGRAVPGRPWAPPPAPTGRAARLGGALRRGPGDRVVTTRRTGTAVAVAVVLTLAGSCATATDQADGGARAVEPPAAAPAPPRTPSPSVAPGSTAAPTSLPVGPAPEHTGPGDFYDVPDPLPPGAPGQLVRTQRLGAGGDGTVARRVMYHTRDASGRDVVATGIVTYPAGPAPPAPDGYPVVAYTHGTEGMAPRCAPSRRDQLPPSFGLPAVVVAPDYVGLGPDGERHAYLSGVSEGRSVVDLVRAARSIADAHAGARWVVAGVSQGGHAALFAGEVAAAEAPDLHLAGIVAVAPASGFGSSFPGDDPLVGEVVTAMAVFGHAVDHPDLRPDELATPELLAASAVLDRACLAEAAATIAAVPADRRWRADPRTTEPARSILLASEPGRRPTAAPILVVQGTADAIVVPARTDALVDRLCAAGAVVAYRRLDGATHDTVMRAGRDLLGRWLADRLAGQDAPDDCPTR